MEEHQDKLDHLHSCEISFPPEILVEVAGGEEVVEVHHAVDPGVQEGTEPALASTDKPGSPPAEPGQGAVVDDVEGREVGELLPGNKEHGVGQVNKLIKNNCGQDCGQQYRKYIKVLALEKKYHQARLRARLAAGLSE